MQSGNDEAVVSLVVDASGLRQGSVEAVALGKRIIDSFKAVEAAAGQISGAVSTSGAGIVKSLGDTNRFLGQIERSLNPLAAAANKAEVEMKRLIGIMGGSNVEAAQRASVALELQAKKVLDLKNVIVLASVENKRLETTYVGLERAFQNAVGSLGSLIAKYQPASASAKQMTNELAGLNAAYKAGLIIEENYIAMNAKIINSYNEGAVAAKNLAESRARLIAQGRADQNVQTAQTGIMQVTGQQAGTDFSRDLRLQMEKDNEILTFEKQIDNEILNSRKQRLAQEVSARKSATDLMIADLKRYQTVQEQMNKERFKFQEQMAPSSSVGGHAADVKKQQDDLAKSVKDTADRFDYLTSRFNQDATAANNYRKTISELNEALAKGAITHRELGLETSKTIDKYNASTVAGQKAAAENKKFSTSIHELGLNTRVAQYAMTNFSFQINDVVSGLAMGQQPFRIFAQQAGQFVQIFQQIGKENIGQFFKDMGTQVKDFGAAIGRWLITPTGLAVTSLTALGVGTALVIGKILEAETRTRSFGVILRTMGTDGLTSAKALDEVVKRLRDTGSAARDAQDAVSAIARIPGINPSRVGDISDTARNISAARGTSLPDSASGLANAIAGGANELTKYAQSLGIRFNPAEQKAIDLAILHRDKIDQLRIAYGAISRVMSGEYEKSLSQTQRLINAFTEQYNKLLDAIGSTDSFQQAIKGLTELGKILTALVKGEIKIAPITIDLKFGSWDFGDMGEQFGRHLRSFFPSEMQTETNKHTFESRRSVTIPPPPARNLRQTLDSMDESSTFNYKGFSGPQFNDLGEIKLELKRFDTGGLKIDTDSLRQLAQIIAEGSKALPEGYRVQAISTQRPGAIVAGTNTPSEHASGRAIDTQIIDPQGRIVPGSMGKGGPLYEQLDKAVETAAARLTPGIAIAIGSRFSRRPDAGHYSLGGPEAISQVTREGRSGELTTATGAGKTDLAQQTADINLRNQALNKYALELVQAQAKISAVTEAEQKFKESTPENELLKQEFVTNAVAEATTKFNDELNKGIVVENLRTKGAEDTAKAFQKGSVEGLKASAMAEAINRNKTEGISIEEAYRQALASGAAEATKSAAEQIASQAPVLTGLEKQADAAKISGKAEHDARIEAEARTVVQRALDAEIAKGTNGQKLNTEALLANARAQILAKEAAQNSLNTTKELNAAKDSQQVLQLQIGLQGETTEEINRQVALLQKVQDLQRDTNGLSETDKQSRLDAVAATQNMTVALVAATREQQRLESGIRTIADTIDSTIGKSITDAFDGKKVDDWGTKLKSMLGTIASSLTSSLFIKPLIGTVLSGMGLTNLGSSFGTFGTSLFGGSTSTSTSGTITLKSDGNGGFKQISDVAGAGKSVFDLFGSGASNIATDSPGFLSSAFSGSELLFGSGLDFGGGGAAMGVADVLGGAVAESGTSGLLGGIFGGAGSALGSILPFAGAAIGIGSLLFGSLFAKKPSNFAAGGNINLAAGGTISGKSNEGNAANTSSANRIIEGISDFAAQLIEDTGGFIAGDLNVQSGSRDGIKIGGSIGNAGSHRGSIVGEYKFSSEAEAIELTSLAMVRLIENISPTMEKVLDTITDLDDLSRAIDFANLYDDLKDAFDTAFADIEPDIVGPYADALEEINDIFDELTTDAIKFGLSLDPINAGLKEANKRLLDDFNKEVADAILALEDPTESLLQIERDAGKVRISDAIAIGADLAEVNRLNELYIKDILDNSKDSIGDLKSEWQSLADLRDELRSGRSSGLTVGEQVKAANDNFYASLRLVQSGDLTEVENLLTNAGAAFDLSEEAFGNAPNTASLRNEILTGIDDVLVGRSFAGGTNSTPEGWIRVGENGPEWMKQSGGNKILPSGYTPRGDDGQLLSEIRKLNNLLEGGNLISREGFSQTINRLEKVAGNVGKKVLSQPTRTKVA